MSVVRPTSVVPAVLLIVFNRPGALLRIAPAISEARPKRVYIAGDGPRAGRDGDGKLCSEVRRIAGEWNWGAEVQNRWQSENLGVFRHPAEAISWFFSSEPEGIILEDDCLPVSDFFTFSAQMLAQFRNEESVMQISGFNPQGSWRARQNDYFFSNLGGIWGWASWARAWAFFDPEMPGVNEYIGAGALDSLLGPDAARVRKKQFLDVASGRTSSWAIPWGYARNRRGGLSVVPSVNLIENIGFDGNATHTTSKDWRASVTAGSLAPPYRTNMSLIPDSEYDDRFFFSDNEYQAIVKRRKWERRRAMLSRLRKGPK